MNYKIYEQESMCIYIQSVKKYRELVNKTQTTY